ncbi:hypothetical protein IMG5_145230 [Ichthyophthirius multifiliis]|uniref:Uncharacterized protein n=1 Tax=Ichthyophthirius multifiliis TaxID=5932 RepID=G0QXU3_ICHMU|nr:hypothetical protein IMG5_145230 [Ichthyophthirius multifiliis]EGR29974.1 hypothetical protein IMG5_145230 [Ichthyophthirius multifiliis]|eukprot:XP_004031210.1 hypothetical protein IMG5_145230 [Ichthyophthirius multifiliis]
MQLCEKKGIFPLTSIELIGSILLILGVGAGQAAGIGGGLIIIPIVIQFFGMDTKKSVAIVFVIIFSASFGNLIMFSKKKSERGDPLIDYKLILISLPAVFVGSTYGIQQKDVNLLN